MYKTPRVTKILHELELRNSLHFSSDLSFLSIVDKGTFDCGIMHVERPVLGQVAKTVCNLRSVRYVEPPPDTAEVGKKGTSNLEF